MEALQPFSLVKSALSLLVEILWRGLFAGLVNTPIGLLIKIGVGSLAGLRILKNKSAILADQVLQGETK